MYYVPKSLTCATRSASSGALVLHPAAVPRTTASTIYGDTRNWQDINAELLDDSGITQQPAASAIETAQEQAAPDGGWLTGEGAGGNRASVTAVVAEEGVSTTFGKLPSYRCNHCTSHSL